MTTEDFEALLDEVDALTDEEALALLKQWRPDPGSRCSCAARQTDRHHRTRWECDRGMIDDADYVLRLIAARCARACRQ